MRSVAGSLPWLKGTWQAILAKPPLKEHGFMDGAVYVLAQQKHYSSVPEILRLWYDLMYRMEKMDLATHHVKSARLTFPACSQFDIALWEMVTGNKVQWLVGAEQR